MNGTVWWKSQKCVLNVKIITGIVLEKEVIEVRNPFKRKYASEDVLQHEISNEVFVAQFQTYR